MDHDGERAIPVPAPLRSTVRGISVAASTNHDQHRVTETPDAATTLVVCATGRDINLAAIGPSTHASYRLGEPVPLRIKVRIHPGRAQLLLEQPVADLVDRVTPLHTPWAEALLRELADVEPTDIPAIADRLERALRARVAASTSRAVARSDLAHRATTLLSARPSPPGVRATAQRMHISERHLRALFTDTVGVSPKHFARINRLRAVLADAGRGPWTELAVAAGYFDHSHLTAEFRAFMGIPPAAFAAGRLPPATPCPKNQ